MSKMMMSEEMKSVPAAPSPLRRLLCWEGFLLAVTLAVFMVNALASPWFLNIWNLSDATFNFTEKAIIVLPMAMLIIAREIDLSVASTMALSSTAMGFCAAAGMDTPLLVAVGLGVGLLCGLFNGILVTRFNLSSIVITIGTMSLYRGITYILLGDKALNHYPDSFAWFGQGYVWGALSFEFALFILLAAAFTFLLHKTNFGRRTYAIGNNPTGAWFSASQPGAVRAGRADGRPGGGSADLKARQYPPDAGDGLGAGGRHDGGTRRRQYSRRFRQHGGGDYRRFPDGAGDVWPEPAQRAGHRDVDHHRRDADCGYFAADYYPADFATKTDLISPSP